MIHHDWLQVCREVLSPKHKVYFKIIYKKNQNTYANMS